MPTQENKLIITKVRNRRVHMANERTFLAWIRTSVSIMAFGFVVEKFSLFVKQIAFYMGKEIAPPPRGYTSVIGILLVALGQATLHQFIEVRHRGKLITFPWRDL